MIKIYRGVVFGQGQTRRIFLRKKRWPDVCDPQGPARRLGEHGMNAQDEASQAQAILAATRGLYEAMYRFDARAAAELGLHVTDLRCVNALEAGPLTAGEIGARLALTSGSVTALINRLVAAGFAERLGDAADRRRARVALLPRFREEADRIYAGLGRAIEAEFAGADQMVRSAAVQVIDRVASGFAVQPSGPTEQVPDRPPSH